MVTALCFVPIVLTAVSYFPIPGYIEFFDTARDIIISLVALGLFVLCVPIENQLNRYREVSNLFREQYDVDVLGFPCNPFIHDEFSEEQQKMYEEGARKYRDYQKYEAWYEEVFPDNHYANVICCQMDNVLYTLYVYQEVIKLYWACTALLIAVIIVPSLVFRNTEALVLVLVSTFGLIAACIQSICEMQERVTILNDMCAVFHVPASKGANPRGRDGQALGCPLLGLDDSAACNLFIREVQHAIAGYRAVEAFIPRFIRLKHLREYSPFYKDLNKIKGCLYAGRRVTRPESAEQILIHNESETALFRLSQVQDILRKMLADVVAAFDANGITALLMEVRSSARYERMRMAILFSGMMTWIWLFQCLSSNAQRMSFALFLEMFMMFKTTRMIQLIPRDSRISEFAIGTA